MIELTITQYTTIIILSSFLLGLVIAFLAINAFQEW